MTTTGRTHLAPQPLTPRQQEVLELLRRGYTNGEIADRLSISLDGAKWHVSEIIGRLGVADRYEAARWRPEGEGRPWWSVAFLRNVRWSTAAKAASAAALAVVTAAIIALAWGVWRADDNTASIAPAPRTIDEGNDGRSDSLTMNEYFERVAGLDGYQAEQSDKMWGGDGAIGEDANPDEVADLFQREIDLLEDFRAGLDDINPPAGSVGEAGQSLEDSHNELVRALGGVTEQFDGLVAELRKAESVGDAFERSDLSEIEKVHIACRALREIARENNISVQYARPRLNFACSFAPHPGGWAPTMTFDGQ